MVCSALAAPRAGGGTFFGGDGARSAQPDPPAIEALFEANVQQIHRMNIAAGSMVKGLIMELERAGRNTFIRLFDAQPDGHVVHYEFVQGDRSLVGPIARSLGFAEVTDCRLEVRHG